MSIVYDFKENIKKDDLEGISNIINSGGLVVFPTETVYGIGADATNSNAVKKIFIAKGRPQDNPLIVHISNLEMLDKYTCGINSIEKKLIDNFWPGPLTIIVKSKNNLSTYVTAGLDTVGVRMPDNDIALNIIEASKRPIAAPSANISGKPSGTNLSDIFEELNNKVDAFVDGGNTNIGIESTVVKVENGVVNILRPGKISLEDIKNIGLNVKLDKHIFKDVKDGEKVESPGMKHRHYAPSTKAILVDFDSDKIMLDKIKEYKEKNDKNIGIICYKEHEEYLKSIGFKTIVMGGKNDLLEISRNIFSLIRSIDKYKFDECLIEGVKKQYIGTAIMNRLIRACGYNIL